MNARALLGSLAIAACVAVTTAGHAATPAAPVLVDARDLLDALVRKGVLTTGEAAEMARRADPSQRVPAVTPAQSAVTRLAIGGRVQAQFVALSAEESPGPDPASTQHFLVRRVYLTARADLGPDWSAGFVYDLVNASFDLAAIKWTRDELSVEAGYRMVNLGREPRISSGSLKAVERSAATRYFMEDSGGATLGAAGYRVGVFVDGAKGPWSWGGALTNPEPASSPALAKSGGTSENNSVAGWLNASWTRKNDEGRLVVGAGLGYIPDQGGAPLAGAGKGDDLLSAGAFADFTRGPFSLLAELLAAADQGASADGGDARVFGGHIQPAWAFSPAFEGVLRIGFLNTDGRGASLKNAIPGSPSTLAADRVLDAYLSANWYIRGDNVKWQAGLVHARGDDTPAGAPLTVQTFGLRSQLQVNF
jgi:hypothetical protein